MKICNRCNGVCVELGTTLEVTTGQGWGAHSRSIVLCGECHGRLEDFLRRSAHEPHQDAIGGALSPTAVSSSMASA